MKNILSIIGLLSLSLIACEQKNNNTEVTLNNGLAGNNGSNTQQNNTSDSGLNQGNATSISQSNDTSAKSANKANAIQTNEMDSKTQAIIRLATDSIPIRTSDGKPARYGIESAEIEFEYSGNVKGTRKMMFDNYGTRELKIEQSSPNPETAKGRIQNYTMLTTLDTFGVTDEMAKQGWIQKNNLDDEYLNSDSAKTMSFGAFVIARANGNVMKKDNIWGKDCAVYQREQNGVVSTIWIWRGLILKEEYSSKQDSISYTLQPKKVSLGMKFKDSDFKLSSDYEMQDLTKNPPKKLGN